MKKKKDKPYRAPSARSRQVRHIVSQVRDHQIELVVADMDLTLTAAFWAGWVPSMWTEVPRLAQIIGEPDLDKVSRELGRIINLRGTHEHPFVLEESFVRSRFKGSAEEFRKQVAEPFWAVQDRNRQLYAQPYPDVIETLTALRTAGIRVVLVSDAPAYQAIIRARLCGFDRLCQGLYALDSEEPAGLSDEDLALGRERVKSFLSVPHGFEVFRVMPKDHEKPSTKGLALAMNDAGIKDPRKVLFVGDSLKKDGGAAQAGGCGFIWARYGLYSMLPRDKKLVDVKFNPDPVGKAAPLNPVYPPMLAQAASFADVLRHLGREITVDSGTILPPSASATATKTVGH